jgi:hypothetical protein
LRQPGSKELTDYVLRDYGLAIKCIGLAIYCIVARQSFLVEYNGHQQTATLQYAKKEKFYKRSQR